MASVGRPRPWMMRPHLDAVILSRLAHSGKADFSTSGTGVDGRWFCHSCACLSSGSLSLGQGLNLLLPCFELSLKCRAPPGGGGGLPHMGYLGMCRCEGYGFQAVYSRIEYVNQSVWV